MNAYYNEIEPFCCGVLRRRIADGSLPAGEVDERDIRQIDASELLGFAQWHLFAGIAGIPLGLRLAAVPDDFPVLTGGFPCVDVSVAGQGAGIGTADAPTDRSGLWWEMLRIIRGVRPRYVVIENVPALRTRGADAVIESLEGAGYRLFSPVDFWPELDAEPEAHIPGPLVVGAWAVGAPHRRDRVWIVAHRDGEREPQPQGCIGEQRRWAEYGGERGLLEHPASSRARPRAEDISAGKLQSGCAIDVAYPDGSERWQTAEGRRDVADGPDAGWEEAAGGFEFRGERMADSDRIGSAGWREFGDVASAARVAEDNSKQWEWMQYAADDGDSDGAGGMADAAQQPEREPHDAQRAHAREWTRQDAGGRSERDGVGLADSIGTGLEGQRAGTGGADAQFSLSSSVGCARWPARPGEPQPDWEYARASLPPALLAIWSRMRARYPQTLRTAEQKREAEKDFGLAVGALDIDADELPCILAGLKNFRNDALTAIGNAVVPSVVAVIGQALLAVDRRMREGRA